MFQENKTLAPGVVHRLQLPKNASGFDSLRIGTKHHRKSMLLSELCVVGVSLPADVAQGQKGRGCMLKCRFSPYTQIEHLRVAILKVSSPLCQLCPFAYHYCIVYCSNSMSSLRFLCSSCRPFTSATMLRYHSSNNTTLILLAIFCLFSSSRRKMVGSG